MRKDAKAIIVVGMHRSGTTAMMGCLERMGVDLGKGKINLNEDLDIQAANKQLLRQYGTIWKDPRPSRPGLRNKAVNTEFKAKLRKLLEQKFGDSGYFAFKDPRISLLLPLYRQVLNEMSLDRLFLYMRRPFPEIAKSLKRRDGMDVSLTNNLSCKYINRIDNNIGDEPKIVIQFQDLVSSPQVISSVYKTIFGGDIPQEKAQKVRKFLNPRLKHF